LVSDWCSDVCSSDLDAEITDFAAIVERPHFWIFAQIAYNDDLINTASHAAFPLKF